MHTHRSSSHVRLVALSLTILILLTSGALATDTHPVLAENPTPIRNTVPIAQLQRDAPRIANIPQTTGIAPTLPGGQTYMFEESFDTYTYRDLIGTTANWDVFSGELTGTQHKALWWQFSPAAALANDGYLYIVWEDERNDNGDIYMQKFDSQGNRQWPADIRVNSDRTLTEQRKPHITAAADGFLYIAWTDNRDGSSFRNVFAQKVDPTGAKAWTTDVRASQRETYVASSAQISHDGAGSIYVAWLSSPSWNTGDIFLQKLDSAGNRLWALDSRVNAYEGSSQIGCGWQDIALATDETGTSFVAWSDERNANCDIFIQKVGASGRRVWNVDLPAHEARAGDQSSPAITIPSTGVVYVAWQDNSADSGGIYLQKLNGVGNRQWANDLKVNRSAPGFRPTIAAKPQRIFVAWGAVGKVCGQLLDENGGLLWAREQDLSAIGGNPTPSHHAIMDASGQFYVTWHARAMGYTYHYAVRVQHVSNEGNRLWGENGLPVTLEGGTAQQAKPDIAVSKTGDVYTTWVDSRNFDSDQIDSGVWTIYAHRHDASGTPVWGNYVWVCDAEARPTHWARPQIAVDPTDRIWVTWYDERPGRRGIYLQILDPAGNRTWSQDQLISPIDVGLDYESAASGGSLYVVWSRSDIYLQKLNSDGQPLWPAPKVVNAPLQAGIYPSYPVMDIDAVGNIYVGWNTHDNMNIGDVYVQKLDSDGNRMWAQDIQVNRAITEGSQDDIALAAGLDDLSVAWVNFSGGSWSELGYYVQQLNSNGQLQWPTEVQLAAPGSSWGTGYYVRLATDAQGNTFAAYNQGNSGVYAQKLNRDGQLLWGAGIKVNDDAYNRWHSVPAIAYAASGRVHLAWDDGRGTDQDIYAQVLDGDGRRLWFGDLRVAEPDARFLPYSVARSVTVDSLAEPIRSATLVADHVLNGGDALYFLSNDGGVTWENAVPGVAHQFSASGSDLRWQILLWPNPAKTLSAIVRSLRIEYSTQPPYADDYEPDDTCATARPIAVNGASQTHTFHQVADADWAWFDATAGTTYVIQTANTQANADTVLELHDLCTSPPLAGDDNAFGSTAQITWQATTSGRFYVKVANHDPALFGVQTGYDLSVRTVSRLPVVVIVAGHNDSYRLQANINYAADMAYRAFLNSGVPKANLRYFSRSGSRDVDGNGKSDDIFGPPHPADVRAAIQDWARERGVALGVPFYLVLADHGDYDQFLANGTAGKIMATDLDLWLSNLEATTGTDNINVIIEACRSGSFIDATALGPAEISGRNRVVIASTSSLLNAYAHEGYGAYFSDAFWTGLGEGNDLKTAFIRGKQAVHTTGLSQEPWLDDNGDAIANDRDGTLASGRGLSGAFAGSPPIIDWAVSGPVLDGRAMIRAQVRDDFGVPSVRAEIYAPDFVEPPPSPDGATPQLTLPSVTLTPVTGDVYAADYNGFGQPGRYRVVLYAHDADGNQALPLAVSVTVNQEGVALYLPLVLR